MNDSDFFHQGTINICGTLDPDRMLKNCFNFFSEYIPLEAIIISIFNPESGNIDIISQFSPGILKIPERSYKLDEKGLTFIEKNTDGLVIAKNESDNPIASHINSKAGTNIQSSVGLHLRIEGEILGVIVLMSQKEDKFNKSHLRLLHLLHDPLAIAISNILKYRELMILKDYLKDDNQYLYRELLKESVDDMIGVYTGLKDVMTMVEQVASIDSKVLILGETGVGKELVASVIHKASSRKDMPFIKLNCGAIPENLIDSELFGHEKGAFTGALSENRGRFERANGGTLFLDEIGELPLNAQTRLLRVLQTGEFERVGGKKTYKANVRIISATHRNLDELVKEGTFREDLLFRINVFPITIPPLRQRKEDIGDFVYYFVKKKKKELNISVNPIITKASIIALKNHYWAGNIRELENCVERELIKIIGTGEKELKFSEFMFKNEKMRVVDKNEVSNYMISTDEMFRIHVSKVLEATKGRIQGEMGAAEILGLNPSTLRNRLRKLKIPFGRNVPLR